MVRETQEEFRSINAPNPKVKTKNGIAILVSIGQRSELIKPMNSTKRSMSSNELSLIPNPKKPIRYIPMIFPMSTIKLLLKLLLGVCFSLKISILILLDIILNIYNNFIYFNLVISSKLIYLIKFSNNLPLRLQIPIIIL